MFTELLISEAPLLYDEETKKYFNMIAAVKTKIYDYVTGALKVSYTNYIKVRPCKVEDFAKTGMETDFYERTTFIVLKAMKKLHLRFKKQKNTSRVLVGVLLYVIPKIRKGFNVKLIKTSFMNFF